jgi:hypothetical protein
LRVIFTSGKNRAGKLISSSPLVILAPEQSKEVLSSVCYGGKNYYNDFPWPCMILVKINE